MSSKAGMMPAAMNVVIIAWNATRTRFAFFCRKACQPSACLCFPRDEITFQLGQLYGSAGSADGRGSRDNVPCLFRRYSRCSCVRCDAPSSRRVDWWASASSWPESEVVGTSMVSFRSSAAFSSSRGPDMAAIYRSDLWGLMKVKWSRGVCQTEWVQKTVGPRHFDTVCTKGEAKSSLDCWQLRMTDNHTARGRGFSTMLRPTPETEAAHMPQMLSVRPSVRTSSAQQQRSGSVQARFLVADDDWWWRR